MYKRALDAGLFASQRQLAAAIGAQSGNVSTAIQLASLPAELVQAFPSPLELQFRWGAELRAALDRDAEGVLARSQEIVSSGVKMSSKEVLARLLGSSAESRPAEFLKQFVVNGKVGATWERDGKGGVVLRVKAKVLSPAKEKRLLEFVERLFD